MPASEQGTPDYGNWVSPRFVRVPLILAAVFGLAALLWRWWLLPAVVFLACGAYFAYARRQFSRAGADLQTKIQGLLLEALPWNGIGQALDIGCGSGAVAIALAKRCPAARVVGVDTWGTSWGYSQERCEANARLEGVAERVSFIRGSAAALPFEAGSCDAVVSNLAFHEVRGADKHAVLREGLRMVRAGGVFAFQDLFLWKRVYGRPEDVVATVRACGVDVVRLTATRDAPMIPRLLKPSFMLGTMAIVAGSKQGPHPQPEPSRFDV